MYAKFGSKDGYLWLLLFKYFMKFLSLEYLWAEPWTVLALKQTIKTCCFSVTCITRPQPRWIKWLEQRPTSSKNFGKKSFAAGRQNPESVLLQVLSGASHAEVSQCTMWRWLAFVLLQLRKTVIELINIFEMWMNLRQDISEKYKFIRSLNIW